jgi:hypothetical protein
MLGGAALDRDGKDRVPQRYLHVSIRIDSRCLGSDHPASILLVLLDADFGVEDTVADEVVPVGPPRVEPRGPGEVGW